MIKKFTGMDVSDNSNVVWVSVFHLYFGFNRKTAYCGNFVKVSVRKLRPESWLRRKTKVKAIIIRVKKEQIKCDGSWIKFRRNSSILLKKRLNTHGHRLFGPITFNVRREKFANSFIGIV